MTAGRLLDARRFEFQYGITIAPHDEVMRVWVPVPSSDEHQTLSDFRFELADSRRMLISECQGNRSLFVELPRSPRERRIRLAFSAERRSRTCRRLAPGVDAPACNASAFLGSDRRVPVEGEFARQAKAVVSEQMSAWEKARTLFDHVLATYSYDPSGCTPAKGDAVGDLQVACDLKLGTCTDLHGVLVAYLRAVGVPARFAF
jgi:transglutaminase-like putative cysteine protease